MINATTVQTIWRLLFIWVVSGWLLGGCSKKIEPEPVTYTQLLTGTTKKTWRLVSFQYIDEGVADNVVQLAQTNLSRCRIDDQYVFYANAERTFQYINGATKCADTEADVLIEDNWTFVPATATIQIILPLFFGSDPIPAVVKNLTQNVLTVEVYYENTLSPPYNINASQRFTFNAVSTQ